MIVVADTSPLNYLVQLKHIDLLKNFYRRVVITGAVQRELLHPAAPSVVRAWAADPPRWIQVLTPASALAIPKLQAGETEAIALAQELNADRLLIDEQLGRDEALRRGLHVIGVVGILLEAHRRRMLNFLSELDELQRLGFRMSPSLKAELIESL